MQTLNFKEINASALGNLGSLVRGWLPNGKVIGREYVALNPTRHDNNLGSFRINLDNGQWIDFATGDKGGDIISLHAYIAGTSQFEAAKTISQNKSYTHPKQPKAPKAPKVDDANSRIAARVWAECLQIENTLAQAYLQNRGITQTPLNIRFHPNLYHSFSKCSYPVMVAAVTRWGSDKVIAIHRTYLDSKTAAKADIDSNKMMLGSVAGGAVQLSRPAKTLVLTEGIENALSVTESTGVAAWAALSSSNYKSFILPPLDIVEEIIIAADNDVNGVGLNKAREAAQIWKSQRRNVRIALPPKQGQDFNDLLRGSL